MRGLVTVLMLAGSAALAPAFALRSTDTMRMWKKASAQERAAALDALLGNGANAAERARILQCLDETAGFSGHGDIAIGEVVQGCREMGKSSEPI